MLCHPQVCFGFMGQSRLQPSWISASESCSASFSSSSICLWVLMPPISSLVPGSGEGSIPHQSVSVVGRRPVNGATCVIAHLLGHEASFNQAGLCLNPHRTVWSQYQYWKCQSGKQPLTGRREAKNKVSFKQNSSRRE